jgi:hypothetical protein
MPLLFKVLGYGGNGLLMVLAIIALGGGLLFGLALGALAGLNLFLVHRLDRLLSAESVLASEIRMARMRQELAAIYDTAAPASDPGRPPLQLPRG